MDARGKFGEHERNVRVARGAHDTCVQRFEKKMAAIQQDKLDNSSN